jgi:hypothetical protein
VTPGPTTTPAASAEPTTSPSPTGTPLPTSTASPSPVTFVWSEPVKVVETDDDYDVTDIAAAVDQAGFVHMVRGSSEGIVYTTNANGDWQSELISRAHPGGYDGVPAIAVDNDGTLAVVFQRWNGRKCYPFGCSHTKSTGLVLIHHSADGWSPPETIGEPTAEDPAIAIRDGTVRLAYFDQDRLWFEENSFDQSIATGISAVGLWPSIVLAADGSPRVMYVVYGDSGYQLHVAFPGVDPAFASVPSPTFHGSVGDSASVAMDPNDLVHVAVENGYYTVTSSGWSEPAQIFDPESGINAGALGVSSDGIVQVVSLSDVGVYAATSTGGNFITQVIDPTFFWCCEDGPLPSVAFATDAAGRPHLFYSRFDQGNQIWYATADVRH